MSWTDPYAGHVLLVPIVAALILWRRRDELRAGLRNGVRSFRPATLLLAFLLLILPPPRSLITAVSPSIQHFVAGFSAAAMSTLHIPVEREGFLLRLPNATLHVDEGCNGVRFLLVLFVIVTGFAHVLIPTPGRRYLLMLAAIPSAVLANAVRVTAIAMTAYLFGPQAASGWTHDYIGRSIWLLTIATLLIVAILLRRTAARPRRSRWDETLQPGPV